MKKRISHKVILWLFVLSVALNFFLFCIYLYKDNDCSKKQNNKSVASQSEKCKINPRSLINRIRENRDTVAYDSLEFYYLKYDNEIDIFPYSLLMANKWKYKKAAFHVYERLLCLYNCKTWKLEDQMDKESKAMAIKYLVLAAKNGHKQANDIIKEDFPELIKELK